MTTLSGWLHIGGTAVDWIYRDLDRVHRSWDDAQAGRFDFHFQIGHPLGGPDFMYAGEVALGVILADPSGEITALQEGARRYPPLLRDALVAGLWEASFTIDMARKAGRSCLCWPTAGGTRRIRRAGPGRLGPPRRYPRRAQDGDRLGCRSLGRYDHRVPALLLRPFHRGLASRCARSFDVQILFVLLYS